MKPYFIRNFANPSSIHRPGQKARSAVEEARGIVAEYLGVSPRQVVFTASGSEANSLALLSAVRPPYSNRKIIASSGEHPSVLKALRWFEKQGATVMLAPLDQNGAPPLEWFEKYIDEELDLVTVMAVNNETGVIYPTPEVGKLCKDAEVHFHSDAVQALGKCELDFESFSAGSISLSGHKIQGPKGIGVLITAPDFYPGPLVFGHQEQGFRGGTENVPAIVGLGEAIRRLDTGKFVRFRKIRDRFEKQLTAGLENIYITGSNTDRIPNTTAVFIGGVRGDELVIRLDRAGYALSTGSACMSGVAGYSAGIESIPLPSGFQPENFIRISFSPATSRKQTDMLADKLIAVSKELRSYQEGTVQ